MLEIQNSKSCQIYCQYNSILAFRWRTENARRAHPSFSANTTIWLTLKDAKNGASHPLSATRSRIVASPVSAAAFILRGPSSAASAATARKGTTTATAAAPFSTTATTFVYALPRILDADAASLHPFTIHLPLRCSGILLICKGDEAKSRRRSGYPTINNFPILAEYVLQLSLLDGVTIW